MRRAIIRSLPAALCLALAAAPAACGRDQREVFAAADGGTISLRDYRGKWTLVNYWATWCPPCREEIPELNHLAEQYGGQAAVLGVNVDAKIGPALQADIRELDIRFPNLAEDPARARGWPQLQAVPTTHILDPRGRLVHSLVGPQTLPDLLQTLNIDRIPGTQAR